MYQFFLRVNILMPQTDESMRSPGPLRAVRDEIEATLRELRISPVNSHDNVRGNVIALNGFETLISFGAKNHDNGMSKGLVDLLAQIAEIAAPSEGMLWTADEASGNWTVHTLKNGEVTAHADPWFSTPGWSGYGFDNGDMSQ